MNLNKMKKEQRRKEGRRGRTDHGTIRNSHIYGIGGNRGVGKGNIVVENQNSVQSSSQGHREIFKKERLSTSIKCKSEVR